MRVRIGVSQATKELEIDVEDPKAVLDGYEKAVKNGSMLWIDEKDGGRVAVASDKILYLLFEAPPRSGIGFSSST